MATESKPKRAPRRRRPQAPGAKDAPNVPASEARQIVQDDKPTPIEGEVVDETDDGKPDGTELALTGPPAHPTGFDPGTSALALLTDDEFDARLAMLKKGRERIATIQRELLIPEQDYGRIPGTDKPTLFKAGAEKLCQFYGLAARIEIIAHVGDNEARPALEYTSTCFLHLGDLNGPVVAVGHGTANSWEKRYIRPADRKCPECGAAALMVSKYNQNMWYCFPKKGGCGGNIPKSHPELQGAAAVNPKGDMVGAHDLGVTLMKMSEKRSHVDATLRATATSGLFTQDIVEDENDDVQLDEGTSVTQGGAVVDGETGEVQGRVDVESGVNGYDESTHGPSGTDGTDEAPGPTTAESLGSALDELAAVTPEEEANKARLTELAAAGNASDPVTGKVDADAIVKDPDPEFAPSGVEGVGRGGATQGSNGPQIAAVKAFSKGLGLGPYGLIDFMMSAGVLDVKVGAAMKEIPDKAAAARALESRLGSLKSNDIGKLIHDLREQSERAGQA